MKNPPQDLNEDQWEEILTEGLTPEQWEKFLKSEILSLVLYSRAFPSIKVQKRVQEQLKTLKMADGLYKVPKPDSKKKKSFKTIIKTFIQWIIYYLSPWNYFK